MNIINPKKLFKYISRLEYFENGKTIQIYPDRHKFYNDNTIYNILNCKYNVQNAAKTMSFVSSFSFAGTSTGDISIANSYRKELHEKSKTLDKNKMWYISNVDKKGDIYYLRYSSKLTNLWTKNVKENDRWELLELLNYAIENKIITL